MGLTTWKAEYSVGIDEIDDQHKMLIDCIANLERSIEDNDEKQRWTAIHYAIVQLSDYTRIHFSVEESLMRILDYPQRETHIAQHKVFVSFLQDIQRKSITRDVTEDQIARFLRDWLLMHISNEDKNYAVWFDSAPPRGNRRAA
jgi:hemerythrin